MRLLITLYFITLISMGPSTSAISSFQIPQHLVQLLSFSSLLSITTTDLSLACAIACDFFGAQLWPTAIPS
jgi:hypothetical protein